MTQAIRSQSLSNRSQTGVNPTTSKALLFPIMVASFIYFVTAFVGVWAAPDRSAAFGRLALFILGFIIMGGIAWGARKDQTKVLGILGLFLGFLATLLTFHFLLTTNWAESGSVQLPLLKQIGLLIHHNSRAWSELQNLHKNITGGVLLVLFPFALMGVVSAWTRHHVSFFILAVMILPVILFGLVMSVSRGAWLGFAFSIFYATYFYWRFGVDRHSILKWAGDLFVLATIILLIYGFYLIVTVPQYKDYVNLILGDSTISRVDLWQDSLPLIQDYWYTGSGLGSTTMVYSSYVFLLHVPFLTHSHNLFMQIAIEQGLPGLIAFVSMVIFTIWGLIYTARQSNRVVRLYCALVIASLAGMLIHGIVEAGLYAHQLVPIVFLPFGFALALLLSKGYNNMAEMSSAPNNSTVQRITILGGLTPSIGIVLLFLWPGSLATLQANLGTVAQTRAELGVYNWPEWSIQDEVRYKQVIDLSSAVSHYKAALTLNPDNVTALRRLGQIEISLGDYDAAKQHLEAAYRVAPQQRATRQMLGELYAISGDADQAVTLWQPVDFNQNQLDIRRWWYYHIEANEQASLLNQAVTLLEENSK